MTSRTWPLLRLDFSAPLDDEASQRLLIDIDDCGSSALDEDDSSVTLYFNDAADRDVAVDRLTAAGWTALATLTTDDVPDEGWAARSQADLPAVRVGRIVVAPPWDSPDADVRASSIVIDVEPSTGFGTGHHQTTRLCLRALQGLDLTNASVLDIGTGSGVLAVAAARLGAASALGIDNDPDAIEAAEDTLRRNGIASGEASSSRVRVECRGLDDATLSPADVVCANLTGALLRQQGARVQHLIADGGCAVLSGFTEDEAPWVREAFDACDVESTLDEEFWIAYVLRRRAPAYQA